MATQLTPHWITGFIEAEGCFFVSVDAHPSTKSKRRIRVEFSVTQHQRDIHLLYALKACFGCGTVSVKKNNVARWRVFGACQLLDKVLPHFDRYPFKGKRLVECERFREICALLTRQVHLTHDGFEKVAGLVAQFRTVALPKTPVSLHPQWIVGFFDGEGCFSASITQKGFLKCSVSVKQHALDIALLNSLKAYFKCGSVCLDKNTNVAVWIVTGMEQLRTAILPFFESHSLKGKRKVEFVRFRRLCLGTKRMNLLNLEKKTQLKKDVANLHSFVPPLLVDSKQKKIELYREENRLR